ncbi:MAG: ABC transporter ATP-binding protein [Lentisphaeria bacterium]|nr:ABC transporter ATP-binding protein [Lentisphaeria bacterium]
MSENAQTPVIKMERVSYAYKKHTALDGISFEVHKGSIHGFVGPNGAGKTTSLKLIATLLKPQVGTIRVLGMDIAREYKKVRQRIGFMPDQFSMYRQMTVFEYLDFFAAAYGLGTKERASTINDILELTDMGGRRDDFLKTLSRGMQQRVSLARVLVNDPEVLLLDEPASGLDPRARIELMEILQELRGMGKTVFISSHILTELGDVCDSITIVDRGRTKYSGPIEGLSADDGDTRTFTLTLDQPSEEVAEALRALEGVSDIERDGASNSYTATVSAESADPNLLLRTVMDAGGRVTGFRSGKRELKRAFMDLTDPGVPT